LRFPWWDDRPAEEGGSERPAAVGLGGVRESDP